MANETHEDGPSTAVVAPVDALVRPQVLANALRSYQQGDEEGLMVYVSRQACDEGADLLERLSRAVEHACYLAESAEQFMADLNRCSTDGEGIEPDDGLSDHWHGLEVAIHEFRKRA